jgi:hypothetical protein
LADDGKQKAPGKADKKVLIVTVLSTVLWVASIILSFLIKPGDVRIFIPDALLLLGFFPLLWLWRRGWVTFLFGLFNGLIGFFLLILQYLPDEKFTGAMQTMRNHLLQMHSSWTWLLLGMVALIWGGVSMAVGLALWIARRSKKKAVQPR